MTPARALNRVTTLGKVGLSGNTQFPHLHLTVRKDGEVVDPFDADGQLTCGSLPTKTLWTEDVSYQSGGLLDVGFAAGVPDYDDVKAGRVPPPDSESAEALVIFALAFGARAGDSLRLRIRGPAGEVIDETVPLNKTQALVFRAVGKRRGARGWAQGRYFGEATHARNGIVLSTREISIRLD